MSEPSLRIARLTPGYDLDSFDCGEPAYSQWLTDHALQSVEAGASMVYLLLEEAPATQAHVVGYFAICPTLVVRDDMPMPLQRKVLRSVPGWFLAKLALDRTKRGDSVNQWGSQLLRAALETIIRASEMGGGQLIVVDAENAGLVEWYGRHGFAATGRSNLRMYMKVATARKYLGPAK